MQIFFMAGRCKWHGGGDNVSLTTDRERRVAELTSPIVSHYGLPSRGLQSMTQD